MKKIIFLCAILSLGMTSNANAVLLLGFGYLGENAVNVDPNASSINATLKFSEEAFSGISFIFEENLSFDNAVGSSYIYTDPDPDAENVFDSVARLLADDEGDYISGLPSGSIFGSVINESILASSTSHSLNGTDFKGYDITRIEWFIDDLYKSDGFNPFNEYKLSTTVYVYGLANSPDSGESNTAPTPSTLLLLSVGLAGIGFGRHKKRRA